MVFSKQDAFLTGYHDLKRTSSRDLRRPGHASTRHFGPPFFLPSFSLPCPLPWTLNCIVPRELPGDACCRPRLGIIACLVTIRVSELNFV